MFDKNKIFFCMSSNRSTQTDWKVIILERIDKSIVYGYYTFITCLFIIYFGLRLAVQKNLDS